MITIQVNGRQVEAERGEMLLDVIRRSGVRVPTLCHLPGLTPTGACRLCSVEVSGQRGLVPSCAWPVSEGLACETHSQRAVTARRTIVELLLANHPDDCNYCVRNGKCELQTLAAELGVRQRIYAGARTTRNLDLSSPSIVRDPEKCILCGRCVRVCEEVQSVGAIDFVGRGSQARVGTAFEEGLNVSSCVNCGQCINVCPTGALAEHSEIKEVIEALRDPSMTVVVQHAPAVSVTLAEEFGMKPGVDIVGMMTAALRRLGFDHVFETSFGADLTVMEEAAELAQRLAGKGPLPMLTSCSPGWVKFAEEFFPEMLPNLSSCKSPQQMLGAIIKSHWARERNLEPTKIFSVAVMPCTAKKFEAQRPEMMQNGVPDVDAVLTTRELALLIRRFNLDLAALPAESPDSPFGERSSAGKLFAASGGVMEAAIRTAHFMVTGKELDELRVSAVRGLKGVKEATVTIGEHELNVAVVSGLANARKLLDEVSEGKRVVHFVEIMGCPGGCINGGGQPIGSDLEAVRARMNALYAIDRDEGLRVAHANPEIKRLYDDFLGEPCGHASHELLHTRYLRREVLL